MMHASIYSSSRTYVPENKIGGGVKAMLRHIFRLQYGDVCGPNHTPAMPSWMYKNVEHV